MEFEIDNLLSPRVSTDKKKRKSPSTTSDSMPQRVKFPHHSHTHSYYTRSKRSSSRSSNEESNILNEKSHRKSSKSTDSVNSPPHRKLSLTLTNMTPPPTTNYKDFKLDQSKKSTSDYTDLPLDAPQSVWLQIALFTRQFRSKDVSQIISGVTHSPHEYYNSHNVNENYTMYPSNKSFCDDEYVCYDPCTLSNLELLHRAYDIFIHAKLKNYYPTITDEKIYTFLISVMYSHHMENTYHNWYHAYHVLLNTYRYLYKSLTYFENNKIDILASLIAAICHDIDHCGINNAKLIEIKDDLAKLYHNISPLENNSINIAQQIIKENKQMGLYYCVHSDEERSRMDTIIREIILATDITDSQRQNTIKQQWAELIKSSARFNPSNDKHRLILLKKLVLCADVGCVCEPFEENLAWAGRLYDEVHNNMNYRAALSSSSNYQSPPKQLTSPERNGKIESPKPQTYKMSPEMQAFYDGQIKFLELYALTLYKRAAQIEQIEEMEKLKNENKLSELEKSAPILIPALQPYYSHLLENTERMKNSYLFKQPNSLMQAISRAK